MSTYLDTNYDVYKKAVLSIDMFLFLNLLFIMIGADAVDRILIRNFATVTKINTYE
ncbi:MAG: hypothetical protein IPO92_03445 [Saprospiraceae bacterium]|nr:hypothetical protein [Saprospiraceae bacterium]